MVRISEEIKRTIKEAVDVELLLRTLGFQVFRQTGTEVRCPCRIHGGDNPTGFSIRLDTKKWKCFTKKCEYDSAGKVDNDLVALVQRVEGLGFVDALQFLADFSGLRLDVRNDSIEETDNSRARRDIGRFVKMAARTSNDRFELPALSEETVARYVSRRDDYFIKQGFSYDTLTHFEIGAKLDRHGVLRATVPIRDAAGRLVSVSSRREDGDEEPRYLLDAEFHKGRILYNLHRAAEHPSSTAVIVEGFKALWALHEAGISNAVACMGADITEDQVAALCIAGFSSCVVLFDGDDAGVKGAAKVEKKLRKAFNVTTAYLPQGVSPDDLDRNELFEHVNLYINTL